MTTINNNQKNAQNDNRMSNRPSRLRGLLAGSGVAGALLLSGIFGGGAAMASQHAPTHTAQVQKSVAANDYVGFARQAAQAAGISPEAFVRQIQQESGFNPGAVSPAGAVGIAQFMPYTAAEMGVNPYDPSSALSGAARMMANMASQFGGDYRKAVAAYNAGPGAVNGAVAAGGSNWLALMPEETQNYVSVILG